MTTSQLVDDADDPVHAVGLRLQRLAEEGRREELEYPDHFESSRALSKLQYPGFDLFLCLSAFRFLPITPLSRFAREQNARR